MSSDNAPDTTLDTALLFDVVDLVGRTGSHRHVERTVPAPPREAGGVAMQVPEGQDIAVEAELESVVEGIYAHGTVTAHLEGECSRCLDPVDQDVTARLDELFMYPEKVKAEEKEDTELLQGDDVNLGPLVRDALAMEADERPLCREDCPGLCAQCGFRMEDDPDHAHDIIDDRFAVLQGLFDEASEEGAEDTAKGEEA
ncbi:COG1399 protein, clustered with ribosomal protein L32p [Brachybacterium faecium]|uniref:Predicted metal-binding protein, possibly nucleic-acid binding n=1 Tax=Brachybacterium faecium (strain ATCC 43885 / DSM 4810 / JCM 11609 / LMG 19847 / NBRC 14762 / NCIMB 9860 / 6-10) TaxID=446465 RepID=C7MDJ9_BRAFD|nr:YceD family protein [Brachybacterium faecium]ACU85656.1 predicted metal-binding protein, possibly nucleic-acid binding [Brachybacterium faecium DSM 4810]SLM92943.1 COG1399 protein, clustered with ribosomal protein L32p [Brachybacterium faecium]HJG51043.1 YceD family protein [Brachybacterium faecium]